MFCLDFKTERCPKLTSASCSLLCRCLADTEMSGENVKLFVGNLPLDATHDELNKLFAPYGEINTCSLLRQYAFVTLKGEGAADR